MTNEDLDWLVAQKPQRNALDPRARERALLALVQHTSTGSGRRSVNLRSFGRPALGMAVVGAAAVAAVVVVTTGGSATPQRIAHQQASVNQPAAGHHHASAPPATVRHPYGKSPLVRLANEVSDSTQPAGDATVVQRTTTTGGKSVTVYDLYADNGEYFFSQQERDLAGQVSAGNNLAGGQFAREIAAAKLAVNGNVQTAAMDMAKAPDPTVTIPTETPDSPAAEAKAKLLGKGTPLGGDVYDNWVWENSQDALIAGAGDPQVRAGVFRILATIPGVTVTNGTSGSETTLVLTAGTPEMGGDYTEQLTIDANTGVPIEFMGGATGSAPATTVDYQVSRVNFAGLAASNDGTE